MNSTFSIELFEIRDLYWCITIVLQLIALQSIIVLITFICAKASVAIATSVCFTFVMCNILRNFLNGEIFIRSCFFLAKDNLSETLIPTSIMAVLIFVASVIFTYVIFTKREIT